jgi:hypothetical protein
VSTNDAIGSAAKANAAGNAIVNISSPSSSNLSPSLQISQNYNLKMKKKKKKNPMLQFKIGRTLDGEQEKKTNVKETKWVAGPGRPEHEKVQILALGADFHSLETS